MMGIDRIEHFMGGDAFTPDRSAYASYEHMTFDGPEFQRIAALYKRHHVYFDATLSAYGYYGKKDPAVFTYFADEKRFLTPYFRAIFDALPPRPVNEPSSDRPSANAIEMPAPTEAAMPTRNVCQVLWVAKAAANSGARVDTAPSIKPSSAGCTF